MKIPAMKRTLILIRLVTAAYVTFLTCVIVFVTNRWFGAVFDWVRETAGDKLMHFLLIGSLAFLVNLSMRASTLSLGPIGVLRGSLILLVLATLEEFSQLMFSSRTFDLMDLACNIGGIIALGSLAWPVGGWIGIRGVDGLPVQK